MYIKMPPSSNRHDYLTCDLKGSILVLADINGEEYGSFTRLHRFRVRVIYSIYPPYIGYFYMINST